MKAISWRDFRLQAARDPARIMLADGADPRAVEAAAQAQKEHIADPVLIGPRNTIETLWKTFSPSTKAPCLDPQELSRMDQDRLAGELVKLSKFKTLSPEEARDRLQDPLILGCLYTRLGQAGGFIGGATRTTTDTLRAVFSVIGLAPTATTLFGFFLIEPRAGGKEPPLVLLADCAVVPDPSSKQLANIAVGAAEAYRTFTGEDPRVAMLSFSTLGSAEHEVVDKVRKGVAMAREKAPDLVIEGEWQADAALDRFSAEIKGAGRSSIAGKANVLVAPDLNCGNIAYKLVQRLGGCRAVGPVLWGTALPANDLSRGCSAEDILDMLALTSLQTQHLKPLEKPTHVH